MSPTLMSPNKKRLDVYCFGGPATPSTRFRVMQYLPELQSGYAVQLLHRKPAWSDLLPSKAANEATTRLVLVQKALAPVALIYALRWRASVPMLYDIDDAIWCRSGGERSRWSRWRTEQRLASMLRACRMVMVANEFIADFARQYCADVRLLPMGIDLPPFRASPPEHAGPLRVGWMGHPQSHYLLKNFEPQLIKACANLPLRLCVMSGKPPQLAMDYEYHPWSAAEESDFLNGLDVLVNPLDDDEFSRGKSPIKVIQAMAAGVAVVGNRYGGSGELISAETGWPVDQAGDWIDAFESLIGDSAGRQRRIAAARERVALRHDRARLGATLARWLGEFA